MTAEARLQAALREALSHNSADCPVQLAQAMGEAVLAGGARLRPQLCLAVAGLDASGSGSLHEDAWLVASAIEILHCASLVHDDLPCFDDASLRRGRPTIHARYGETCAVLVGDALIMTAFAQLGRLTGPRAGAIHREFAYAARRMVWGQALESEPQTDLSQYHGHKTAALFEAAAVCGAWLAAQVGPDQTPDTHAWRAFGSHIGALYQMADDILDVACAKLDGAADKSAGRDVALGRPNAALQMGLAHARAALELRLQQAEQAIVQGFQQAQVRAWFDGLVCRLSNLNGLWQTLTPQPRGASDNLGARRVVQPGYTNGDAAS